MAEIFGALAQVAPTAATLTDAYTVPVGKRAVVEVVLCNRAGGTTVRLQHAVNGAASADAQYLLYNFPLGANESKATAKFTAKAGDVVRTYSASGSVSFNINGIEEDI